MNRSVALSLIALAACGGSTPDLKTSTAPLEGALYGDGEVVAYVVKGSTGGVIGRIHSTYRAGESAQVQTRMAIVPNASGQGEVSVEMVTTLRADGSPVTFKKLSSLEGRYEIRFQDRSASVITGEGAREARYTRSPTVLWPRRDLMMLSIALFRAKLSPGTAKKIEVLSPENVEKIELDARAWSDAEQRTVVQLPAGKATLTADGRVLRYEEADTGFVLEREDPPGAPPKIDPPTEPQKYVRPVGADWSDRDVSIDVKDGTLAGMLSEPRLRANLERANAPGVVFISGAGAQDRHGFGGGIDNGTWQIFDRLVDDGFAVLRADDRGAGSSTSTLLPEQLGIDTQLADAAKMLAFMRAQPEIDPDRIFVIGHGQGGLIALMLAAKEPVAGVVLLASPYRTLPELVIAEEMETNGTPREKAEREMRLVMMALQGNQVSRAEVPPQKLASMMLQKQMLLDHLTLDVPNLLKSAAKSEIAVFQGMKDFQVSWKADAKMLVDTLKKYGNKSKLYVYENVDHLMKEEPGQSSLRRYADRSRRMDSRVLDDLSAWLIERAKKSKP
jgi:pimeloyl-ACP methyl ester carboxylesterase